MTALAVAAAQRRPRKHKSVTALLEGCAVAGELFGIGEMLARMDFDIRFSGEKERREISLWPASTTCFCAPGNGVRCPRLDEGDRWPKAAVGPAVAATGLAVGPGGWDASYVWMGGDELCGDGTHSNVERWALWMGETWRRV